MRTIDLWTLKFFLLKKFGMVCVDNSFYVATINFFENELCSDVSLFRLIWTDNNYRLILMILDNVVFFFN